MEVRRSARIATEFLVAVDFLDPEPVLRTGNLSATGIYFITDTDVGEVGTIVWLSLASANREKSVRVMSYVVRRATIIGIDGKEVSGAAFEFMPDSEQSAAAVQDFVRYMLALRRDGLEPQ